MTEKAASLQFKRRHWILIATAVVVAFGGIAAYDHHANGPVAFEPVVWRNGERWPLKPEGALRLRMADGLIKSGTLIGKRRDDIEQLLGPRTDTGKFAEYGLVYWLGPERGLLSIDSEWLVIRFDASGIATEVQIVFD